MASERISDELLATRLQGVQAEANKGYREISEDIASALSELRERRALDLTADEREALEYVRQIVRRVNSGGATEVRALDALDKLLARGGESK